MKKKLFRILSLALALTLVFSLAACSGSDGDETTEEETTAPPIIAKTAKPETVAEVVEYFNNNVINVIKTEKIGFKEEIKKDVSNFESENEYLKAAASTLEKLMLSTDKKTVENGEDMSDSFPVKGESWSSILDYADVSIARCVETYDTYEISIQFADELNPDSDDSTLGKAFDLVSKLSVLAQFNKSKDYLIISDYDALFRGCRIDCVVMKETDRISSITYTLIADITSQVTGEGELTGVDDEVHFTYTKTSSYNEFSWPVDEETTVAE